MPCVNGGGHAWVNQGPEGAVRVICEKCGADRPTTRPLAGSAKPPVTETKYETDTGHMAMLHIQRDPVSGAILAIAVQPFAEIDDELNDALFTYLDKIHLPFSDTYPLSWEG